MYTSFSQELKFVKTDSSPLLREMWSRLESWKTSVIKWSL